MNTDARKYGILFGRLCYLRIKPKDRIIEADFEQRMTDLRCLEQAEGLGSTTCAGQVGKALEQDAIISPEPR